MTTDRELLELAARAMGLHVGPLGMTVYDDGTVEYYKREPSGSLTPKFFNSLQDDGDALRLAVKLRLSIDHNHSADQQRWVAADRNGCEGCYAPVSCVEDDFDDESQRSSATRRAITCAAAQVQLQKGAV